MKGTMMIFAPVCLLFCWMLPVDSMAIRYNFSLRDPKLGIPLSIVENSVDDMYFGCYETMMKTAFKYLQEEKHMESLKDAWNDAEECAERKLAHREDKALTKHHIQAICVYTDDRVYEMFNKAVRIKGTYYGSSSFQYHSLHFLLTSAIQILNSNYYCHTTYRRTNIKFTGKVNQIIRFGSFASSSYRTDMRSFGNESCFKIKTCSGAFLKNYSEYVAEEEVLIPPYETFKITAIFNGTVKIQGLNDCKVVYVVESAGVKSNLNCKLANP